MRPITTKEIIDFNSSSDYKKKQFGTDLRQNKPIEKSDGGGHYWVICLSAISNSYKADKLSVVEDKVAEFQDKLKQPGLKSITKNMYLKNIDILEKYLSREDYKFRPNKLKISDTGRKKRIISIQGFQLVSNPQFVFSVQRNGQSDLGAVWFVAKKDGYKSPELAIILEVLYRHLKTIKDRNQTLNPKLGFVVDLFHNTVFDYSQIINGRLPKNLNSSLTEIKKYIA